MTARKILITGGTGQIGTELRSKVWPENILPLSPSREELSLESLESIREYLLKCNPDLVINCAAYTAVDNAENDTARAFQINALAAAVLADITKLLNIPIIYVSTDYVFDGTKQGAYKENDPISPINIYGASKAAGEIAVRLANPRHLILRTAWVFSPHGHNFMKTMIALRNRSVLRVVDDQHGCPTSASDIAGVLMKLGQRLINDPEAPTGTYHFVNNGPTTWCDFARAIFKRLEHAGHKVPTVEAISSKDYPTNARRPANSVLSTQKLENDYLIQSRGWLTALDEIFPHISIS